MAPLGQELLSLNLPPARELEAGMGAGPGPWSPLGRELLEVPADSYEFEAPSAAVACSAPPLGPAGPPRGKLTIDFWQDLMNFRPPTAVQQGVVGRGANWSCQQVEATAGSPNINLDYYPIRVSRLPRTASSPEQLLEILRQGMTSSILVDPSIAVFLPYSRGDQRLWQSANSLGMVMRLKFITWRVTGDHGAVVCSHHSPQSWVFTTIYTPKDWGHPLRGHRQWGFMEDPAGGYIFYTRAIDRLRRTWMSIGGKLAWTTADALWKALQRNLVAYVQDHGGRATALTPTSLQLDWYLIKNTYFCPPAQPGWVC